MLSNIVLIGYSGHGLVVGETAIEAGMPLKFYTEKKPVENNLFNLDYLGFEGDENFDGWSKPLNYILGIGDNHVRNVVALRIGLQNKLVASVIHPSANLSRHITVGKGNFIAKNVAVNTMAKLGDYCILNTGCIIEHECSLGNAVHIAPGAVLAGNVSVGNFSFIGANTTVKQGVKIGDNVIIGAGSVIIKDIPDNQTIVGNPGKAI
ncbi:MAG TPA: acetyltransferase [Pseudosphingobacterium sp.]|nr:acetyltransferase [Pseudosphingobacterium sp.]